MPLPMPLPMPSIVYLLRPEIQMTELNHIVAGWRMISTFDVRDERSARFRATYSSYSAWNRWAVLFEINSCNLTKLSSEIGAHTRNHALSHTHTHTHLPSPSVLLRTLSLPLPCTTRVLHILTGLVRDLQWSSYWSLLEST